LRRRRAKCEPNPSEPHISYSPCKEGVQPLWTPHRRCESQPFWTPTSRTTILRLCYSVTFLFVLDQKGLSFLGSLIHTGNGIWMEQRDRDDGRDCRRWSAGSIKPTPVCVGFRLDLARSFGFPARSGQNPRSASLSDRIQREIWPEYALPLSFSVVGRRMKRLDHLFWKVSNHIN